MQAKSLGYKGEKLAVEYLKKKGYEIIDHNFTVRGGEIDIIAKEKDITVFVEVKTRTNESFGAGEDSYTRSKARRIQNAIELYIDKKMLDKDPDYRVDLIEIDIDSNSKIPPQITHFQDIEL